MESLHADAAPEFMGNIFALKLKMIDLFKQEEEPPHVGYFACQAMAAMIATHKQLPLDDYIKQAIYEYNHYAELHKRFEEEVL